MSLPRLTVLRVAMRSLFIQAGFSPDAMQTLGLLYALEPAWRHLYPDEAARQVAVHRHLTPFNTHPYAAAAIVGGILFHEERIARGDASPEAVTRFKQTLMGPLAALGDGFYWLSLRPATAALGAALVPLLEAWAPVVFLVLYNLVHVSTRAWLFVQGYRHGDGLVAKVTALRVPVWSHRLRTLTAACAGGVAAWLSYRLGELGGGDRPWLLGAAGLGLGGLGAVLLERKVPPLALLYGAAALAVLAGVLW